jgi:hypothetical protein
MKSICKKISFLSDNFLLRGILHIPAVEKGPVIIGSHGLLSSGNSPKQIALARRCNDFGIAFFRFDHRGCGKSKGFLKKLLHLMQGALIFLVPLKQFAARATLAAG